MLQTKRLLGWLPCSGTESALNPNLGTNGLGYIEVTTPPDTDHHLVDVKFFDQSKGKISFKDEFKYNLGVLGKRVQ